MSDVAKAELFPETRAAGAWGAEMRALLKLSGPLIATQVAQMAVITTDVLLLGRFSPEALAAAAIGNVVYYFAWLLCCGPANAVAPMIAQLIGANPNGRARVQAVFRMGLWAAVLTAAPLMLVMLSGEPILRAAGQEARLAHDAGLFLTAMAPGLPFAVGYRVLANYATALSRPAGPFWVILVTILVNAGAGWTLIFGEFGLPALGVVGSGIATAVSSVFSFAAMAAVIRFTPALRRYQPWRGLFRPAPRTLSELTKLGLPIGLTMMFEAMLFNVMTLVMGTFGAAPLAAHQIALNFASLTFMVPLGVALGATVRVGLHAGRGDMAAARRAGLVAMTTGVAAVTLSGVAMAGFGRDIAGLYVADRGPEGLAVIGLAGTYLLAAAAFQVFDALQVVGALALRGLKDARMPMILAGASYWLVGAPVCLWLALGLKMQGLGVWIGLAVGLAAAAAAMCGRFLALTRDRSTGSRPAAGLYKPLNDAKEADAESLAQEQHP
jgi:MATE family multidrug resistance protein